MRGRGPSAFMDLRAKRMPPIPRRLDDPLSRGERPFSDLDEWLRRRLRQVRWKEWKRPVTRRRNLRAFGIPDRSASRDSLTHITVSGTLSEPPGADPHAGWCERRRGEPGAYPMLLRGFQEAGDRNTACWAAK
jgi:hypothetical protein